MSVHFASFDRTWKQTAETAVDARVCECCPTAAVVTRDGPVVAYRNRAEGEIRDIHMSRLQSGVWSESKAVHDDNWKINACPVNGPMLAARGANVAIAWFTAAGDEGRALLAFSKDSGRSFAAPIRLDDAGSLGRVDLEMLADSSVVATWIEFAGGRAQFRARRVTESGVKSEAVTVAGIEGSRASGYPRVAAFGDEIVLAWVEPADTGSMVRTAVMAAGTSSRD